MTNPAPHGSVPKVSATRALLEVVRFLGRHPWGVATSLSLLLANICIELSLPWLLGLAMDHLEAAPAVNRLFTTPGATREQLLAWLVASFVGLVVLRTLIGLLLGPIRNRTAQQTLGDLRAAVYDALQRQTFAWHDNARVGELISRASTDIGRLQEFMFVCLLFSLDILAGLLGALFVIFTLSPTLGWISLAALVPTVVTMGFFAGQLQPRWRRVHDQHGAMSTIIQENIAGVRVVKAFARQPAEIAKFRTQRDAFLRELFDAVNYWAARVPLAQFLFGLGIPLVLWIGGRQVLAGTLSIGGLSTCIFYLLGLGNRIGVIGQVTNIVQNASASAQRIHEILHAPHQLPNGTHRLPLPSPGAIEFQSVTFRYPRSPSLSSDPSTHPPPAPPPDPTIGHSRPNALHNLSFRVHPGQTVALVGPTASGKSTVLALIPRFYDPDAGRILIDGADLRTLDLQSLRSQISVVFQEVFLFSASVADNIAFGRPTASRAELVQAAQAAHAHEFITQLPQGYDTVIGERGISLSGGQRQRIAIARALLLNPAILLLDDAASAVDPRTERDIRDALARLRQGRTTLVVAHRAATVRHADHILVFRDGQLAEQGSHHDLLARGGLYLDLFRNQLTDGPASSPSAPPAPHAPPVIPPS